MTGQHCFTHSHNLIIGKLISVSNWHVVHLLNLQVLGPTLGPKSGRIEIKIYKKNHIGLLYVSKKNGDEGTMGEKYT